MTRSGTRRRWLRVGLRLLGPVLLVVVLWKIGDPQKLWTTLKGAGLLELVAACLLILPAVHLKVERWRTLLRACGHRYSLGRAYQAFLASVYLGLLTPGHVGDALRVQYLRHDLDVPYAEGLAISVMDRMCDVYTLLAFVAFGIVHFATVLTGEVLFVAWVSVAVLALVPLALLLPGLAERLMGRVYARVARDPDGEGLACFLAVVRKQVGKPLLLAMPLSVAATGFNYAQGFCGSEALGLGLSFVDVMAMMAAASLLGLLPISVSGVGVREAFLALLFPALGLAAAQGVAFGLVVFVAAYLTPVLLGFVAWQIAPPPFEPEGRER